MSTMRLLRFSGRFPASHMDTPPTRVDLAVGLTRIGTCFAWSQQRGRTHFFLVFCCSIRSIRRPEIVRTEHKER